eukprot:gene4607-4861_t
MTARWVECSTVAELIMGPMKDDVAIVDVRDEDFYGGHIKDAIHWESTRFCNDADVDALIDLHLANKGRAVVHCMMSQQRGPRCAAKLAQRLQERSMQQPAVLVMTGGFSKFNRLYGSNPDLVELDSAP